MTMTAPPREPQSIYDALSTIYDWLCDDRLTQWPYMENGPFYSDLPKYQEVARVALAAAPAPSAEPPAMDDLVARLSVCAPSSVADDAIAELQRQAREMAELQRKLTNEENYYEDMKIRAERAEAERDALRECVRAADAMRRDGFLPAPDSGLITVKQYDAARAKVPK